ncbi:polysaccharide biosynthesis/export family protein [Histidinibacterium aquaticum]|nr:polysaccharide biosynthesis/export family protein [Histidinibacterium aquaticum]
MHLRIVLLMAVAVVLSACDALPRGAGLQREVLAAQTEENGVANFAVEPVTRENLPLFDSWPVTDGRNLSWIERVDQPNNRIIAPGDTLAVTIWSTEDNGLLTAPGQRFVTLPEMRVSSSGRIFLPYIGSVRVEGMAPETARSRIEEQYLVVTPSAQVQLEMQEGNQNTVNLVSGVRSPGTYPLPDRDFTIMGLLSLGGGVPDNLRNPQIRLQRGGQLYGTSVDRLLESPGLDTTLRGGDKVFVEQGEDYFLSLGAARTESIHYFPQEDVTAIQALSIIGGVDSNRADAQGILILRKYPASAVRADRTGPQHERTIFTIDLTSADGLFSAGEFHLQSGDLVYVTESPLTTANAIIGVAGAALGLGRTVDALAN